MWRIDMRLLFIVLGLLAIAVAAPSAQKPSSSRAKSAASATASAPVNLNTATQAQLETLPGIGASAAQRILEYRQKNGSFKKIEDLMNVKGIGEKSFLKLKPLITVGTDKGERASGTR
jgi:competence protein ComEA